MYNWTNEFKRVPISTRDEPGLGCPVKAATPKIIKKVQDMILNDQRVKMREIFEAIGIYHVIHGTVITIWHEKLTIKKLLARWVPRLLTVGNKRSRVSNSMAASQVVREAYQTSILLDKYYTEKNSSSNLTRLCRLRGTTSLTTWKKGDFCNTFKKKVLHRMF